jgi:DNA adenine methylase
VSAEPIATRPPLRYHGGKWRLAPWIIGHLPPHRIYVEPFMGGCSVLLRKPRSYAEAVNDRYAEVVNFFRVLRDPALAVELERVARLTPFARDEFLAAYEATDDPVERARRLLVRSFMGFGSAGATREHLTGFRGDVKRAGTTGASDWTRWPDQVRAFTARLRGVTIENKDALDVIRQHDTPETVFYVDPPYPYATRDLTGNGSCYAVEMTDGDHGTLAEALAQVAGMVVLSGYPCALYDELFGGWHRVEREAMANGQEGGVARTEVLWLNSAAVAARRQGQLFQAN